VPSRKQRRRRLKERRHEYEYVYVDEEGREVEAPEEEQTPASPRGGAKKASGRRAATTRAGRGRRIQPPSWNRVGKRALFFGPVMFLLLNLVGKNLSVAQRIYETVVLLAIFLPFSYLTDSLMYRSYLKRTGAAPPPRRRGSNGAA